MRTSIEKNNNFNKIKIGFTLGDLGGIGPEIFEKFRTANLDNPLFEIILVDEWAYENPNHLKKLFETIEIGKPSQISGEHAYQALKKANELALAKKIDYLITCPVAKESLAMAGYDYSGQTELLASLNNLSNEDIEMFFVLDDFRVVLATRHIALSEVVNVFKKRFHHVVNNSYAALKLFFKIDEPRIAIAGVNPHAGENGLIGKVEEEFLKPFIENFNANFKGPHKLQGPFPADTMFAKLAHSYLANQEPPFDLYVAAYHDQVLSLVKGLGGFRAINLTTGLPYMRVSVDHGTAYDIAGKGIADPEGLKACVEFILKNSRLLAKAPNKNLDAIGNLS